MKTTIALVLLAGFFLIYSTPLMAQRMEYSPTNPLIDRDFWGTGSSIDRGPLIDDRGSGLMGPSLIGPSPEFERAYGVQQPYQPSGIQGGYPIVRPGRSIGVQDGSLLMPPSRSRGW
jgi:hypothetical protein